MKVPVNASGFPSAAWIYGIGLRAPAKLIACRKAGVAVAVIDPLRVESMPAESGPPRIAAIATPLAVMPCRMRPI
jgi:hypothetical protein